MILWTIQPVEIMDIINTTGEFYCDKKSSANYSELKDAYDWLVSKMDERNITHPSNIELPLWAWHTRDWKHKKPDLRLAEYTKRGQRCVCIEFEIPDEDVLLSDYDNWHYVLNNAWFDDAKSDDEWDALHEWYDKLPSDEKVRLRIKSWNKVFDVIPYDDGWDSKGRYVQATFWKLTSNMIKDVRYFTAR